MTRNDSSSSYSSSDRYSSSYNNSSSPPPSPLPTLSLAQKVGVGALVVSGCAVGFIATRYHIAKPHQYLVKTGLGIKQLSISKTTVRWPLQLVNHVDMRPSNYNFRLHNMSKEKVEFSLPINFTIGPMDPLENALGFEYYARRMTDMNEETLSQTILGIVEGETRGLTSVLTVEEMFSAKDRFKDDVVSKIQAHLEPLGLKVYNANIKEMGDYDANNKYFEYRKQRAIESANYDAQISVSEARKTGEIGVKERQRDTAIAVASLNMETKLVENERQQKVLWSESELAQQKASAHQAAEMKRIEAEMKTQQFEQEMFKELEKKRQEREMETLRATDLTKTHLLAEQKTRQAEADAVVIKTLAEAEAHATCVKAEAQLEQEKKRAEGIQIVLNAHANGLQKLTDGQADGDLVKFYLGLKDHLFQDIAKTQADAFKDMKPNFQIWSTGPQAGSTDPSEVITRTLQNMAPLFSGLTNQSGMKIPFFTGNTKHDSM